MYTSSYTFAINNSSPYSSNTSCVITQTKSACYGNKQLMGSNDDSSCYIISIGDKVLITYKSV